VRQVKFGGFSEVILACIKTSVLSMLLQGKILHSQRREVGEVVANVYTFMKKETAIGGTIHVLKIQKDIRGCMSVRERTGKRILN
jgi:hypothetical protein